MDKIGFVYIKLQDIYLIKDLNWNQANTSSPTELSHPNIQRTLKPSLQGSVDQLPPTLDTTSILRVTQPKDILLLS